jgi:uncharacterized protein (DUF2147 family)
MTLSRPVLALAATLLVVSAGGTTAAPTGASPVGLWLTPDDHGQIEVFACGSKLCGRIVTSDKLRADPGLKDAANKDPALRDRPLKGLVIMTGFNGGPARWTGGAIYRPQDGGAYQGTIDLIDARTLKLKGCIVAPLCQTQVWKRAG